MPNAKRARLLTNVDVNEMESMTINELLDVIDENPNNKIGRQAANVYGEKYGRLTACLGMKEIPSNSSVYKVAVKIQDDYDEPDYRVIPLDASHTNDAEQFIRKIGHKVTSIYIDYTVKDEATDDHRWRTIERLISTTCSSSLLHLSFKHSNGDAFRMIRQTFSKVESLWFTNSFFTKDFERLISLFPAVAHLVIDFREFGENAKYCNNSMVLQKITNTVSNLIEFNDNFKNFHPEYKPIFNPESGPVFSPEFNREFRPLISSGFQHLKFSYDEEYETLMGNVISFLRTASRKMPNLKILELYNVDLGQFFIRNVISFPSVRSVCIRLHETKFPVEEILMSFENVEEMEIYGFIPSKIAVKNFVVNAPTLQKLDFNLARPYGEIGVELEQFAIHLKHIEKVAITLYDHEFDTNILTEFIRDCEKLRKLRIRFPYGIVSRREALAQLFNDTFPEWDVIQQNKPCKPYGYRVDLIIKRRTIEPIDNYQQ